ncbi:flagellar biosynthetic protein FliR [Pseudemcibacter aquimaris]|uniref:flagellar biosynthetic protein FliR n=1 Tax=Pseudemcibacter aquimaris TaxID=2857064 RepID=UPI0020132699|nr:flagellar biosynthetic protein FliR [Pseudemcibacter aquimaris]MCC3860829.1 flagellar type III secretion system protein FliR [Pseudemcibacter aquimaris]WDU59648.1 flagellar type III secretion system protein FliR [Pseudemcibacter aquimaris]
MFNFLPQEAFGFLLIFTRLGTMVMIFPALGETSVPARVRLFLSLSITLIIYGLIRESMPLIPNSPVELGMIITKEILIGVMIGLSIRLLVTALHVAGTIIAMQTGLAMAQAFDPAQGGQSSLVATFMTLLGVVFVFVTDTHHLMISAMHNSYSLFPIGNALILGDFAELIADTVANSFRLGLQIASPFIVYALVFNAGLGIIARLVPQIQVFFVAMPINIMMGFVILAVVIGAAMTWYIDYLRSSLEVLL